MADATEFERNAEYAIALLEGLSRSKAPKVVRGHAFTAASNMRAARDFVRTGQLYWAVVSLTAAADEIEAAGAEADVPIGIVLTSASLCVQSAREEVTDG